MRSNGIETIWNYREQIEKNVSSLNVLFPI